MTQTRDPNGSIAAMALVRGFPGDANRTVFCLECASDPDALEEICTVADALEPVTSSEIRDEIIERLDYPFSEGHPEDPAKLYCELCGEEIYDYEVWELAEYPHRVIASAYLMSAIFNGDTSSFTNEDGSCGDEDNPTDDDLTLGAFYDSIRGYEVVDESFMSRYSGYHSDLSHPDHMTMTRDSLGERVWRHLAGQTVELLLDTIKGENNE